MKSLAPRSTARRRTALLAVLLAPALAACGFGVQTDQPYQPAQGVNDRTSNIQVLNATIVAAQDGSGTFAGSFVNETSSAQNLTNVTGTDITPGGKGVKIPGMQGVNLSLPGADGGPQLTLTGSAVKIGGFAKLTFTFSGGAVITLDVPVVSNDPKDGSEFSDVPLPTEAPTEAATAGTDG